MLVHSLLAAAVTTLAAGLGCRPGRFRSVTNFEGRPVRVAGLALALGLSAGLAPAAAAGDRSALAALAAVCGFALFGWLDDAFGDRSASGFRGHLREALRGRLTTGFWKIVGGGLTALLAAFLADGLSWRVALNGAAIALAANGLNLLDTRPVRALAGFLALAAVTSAGRGLSIPLAVGIAGALAFLPWDRTRRAMLGDAGSNALGALWGVALVVHAPWETVAGWLALLLAFHAFTEARSLNATLAASPPLDRLDRWLRG